MKLLFLLIILFLLICFLFILRSLNVNESFIDTKDNKSQNEEQKQETKTVLDNETINAYNDFLKFYNSFCPAWEKTIQTAVTSELSQKPLTDPSQIQSSNAPSIDKIQMNNYIIKLSQETKQQFPEICEKLPNNIDVLSISNITKKIPSDIQPYMNALKWMNKQLTDSQQNLSDALKGNFTLTEGFEDMCQNISKCITQNPSIANEILKQIEEQELININQKEQELINKVQPFIKNTNILNALNTNKELIQKSQEIQNQAESGELINKIDIPDSNTTISYEIPSGGNALDNMKRDNPEKYNDLEQNYKEWFDMKTLFEQINRNLK